MNHMSYATTVIWRRISNQKQNRKGLCTLNILHSTTVLTNQNSCQKKEKEEKTMTTHLTLPDWELDAKMMGGGGGKQLSLKCREVTILSRQSENSVPSLCQQLFLTCIGRLCQPASLQGIGMCSASSLPGVLTHLRKALRKVLRQGFPCWEWGCSWTIVLKELQTAPDSIVQSENPKG